MNTARSTGLIGVLVVLFWGPIVHSATTPDISGHWTVTWPGAGQHSNNEMSLVSSGDGLTGNYINDAGDSCAVTGAVTPATNRFRLHIDCTRWSINMDGTISPDGRSASGDYQAYQSNEVGQFTMNKN